MDNFEDDFDLNLEELSKWENLQGYKWENENFKNLIASVLTAGDCSVRQINKKDQEEKKAFTKREVAWSPLTAIFVKYVGLVNKNILKKIKKHKDFNLYDFNKEPIEFYLNQSLFWWDKPNIRSNLNLNNPLYRLYSFLKKKKQDSLELHLMYYKEDSKINIFEAIETDDIKKREKSFGEGIIYYPVDCYNLLEAILNQSPYNPELAYAVHLVLSDPNFFY